MNREQLAHILTLASKVDPAILVIGSQAILATYEEAELPPEATRSIEADIAFFDDPEEAKSDTVDAGIGELSPFHDEFGVYGQGVSVTTAVLPIGWENRLVPFPYPPGSSGKAVCLEAHDLVVAKLVRGDPKDREFAKALIEDGLVSLDTLRERARGLADPRDATKVANWLDLQG